MRQATLTDSLRRIKQAEIPIDTILDVGVQQQTCPLRQEFPDKLHLLFEPIEMWFSGIRHHYQDVPHELLQLAVSDHDGVVKLSRVGVNADAPLTHARHAALDADGDNIIEVPSCRLDTFLASRHYALSPYLLKIDVDGDELRVLAGAEEVLGGHANVVVMEAHPKDFWGRNEWVLDRGFVLWDMVDLCYYDGWLAQFDLVYVKEEFMPTIGRFDLEKWERHNAGYN